MKILQEFIERPALHSSYNITTGEPITLIEIAEIVREVLGKKHDIVIKNRKLGDHYTGNNEHLKKFLPSDFKFTPIQTAIEELANWYAERMDTLNKDLIINTI